MKGILLDGQHTANPKEGPTQLSEHISAATPKSLVSVWSATNQQLLITTKSQNEEEKKESKLKVFRLSHKQNNIDKTK